MQIYKVPVSQAANYKDEKIVIRSEDPAELVECYTGLDPTNVLGMQLYCSDRDARPLLEIGAPLPCLDILLEDNGADFPKLYNYTLVREKYPMRVIIPMGPGLAKAAKVAISLFFPVHLEAPASDQDVTEEVMELVDYYLHGKTVGQPIEFFHSVLMSFYHQGYLNMWTIQAEDPAQFLYITDAGKCVISERLKDIDVGDERESFLRKLKLKLLTSRGECATCLHFGICLGYFQMTDPEGRGQCLMAKNVFDRLKHASTELRDDFSAMLESERTVIGDE